MQYDTLAAFQADRTELGKGPFAVVICEDRAEVGSTLDHVFGLGFRAVFMVAAPDICDEADRDPRIERPLHTIHEPARRPDIAQDVVNALIDKAPGQWLHYCYNGEYLFYPFCEDRSVGEMTTWVMEERRIRRPDLRDRPLCRRPEPVSRCGIGRHGPVRFLGYYAETRRRG
jgi:hypothetical protein